MLDLEPKWTPPFRGLVTIKHSGNTYWVSLYDGDSWIQRDSLKVIQDIAEHKGIDIVEVRRQQC
ncbi:hypothetical protein CMI37_27535 [Candidatus Pacearchaeota archaeon]|jgi:hypothetical protein|nr:hypothetical protein [Candidatus Pacearchaeota archaeon]|tara:strand:+ start:409 stop:600 length:192 start_codon:yes stop_codon:yes gene_type:complete